MIQLKYFEEMTEKEKRECFNLSIKNGYCKTDYNNFCTYFKKSLWDNKYNLIEL